MLVWACFDYIKVAYPVPEFEQYNYDATTQFQTKDLCRTMDDYLITAEGELKIADVTWVDKVYPADDPWLPGQTVLTRTLTGEYCSYSDRWSRPYHGYLVFYTSYYTDEEQAILDDPNRFAKLLDNEIRNPRGVSTDFRAKFTDGVIEELVQIPTRWLLKEKLDDG